MVRIQATEIWVGVDHGTAMLSARPIYNGVCTKAQQVSCTIWQVDLVLQQQAMYSQSLLIFEARQLLGYMAEVVCQLIEPCRPAMCQPGV